MKVNKTKALLERLVGDLKEQALVEDSIESNRTFLVAGDGTFLGLIADQNHQYSILNRAGSYGSSNSGRSIFNSKGSYGGRMGKNSPFNADCEEPPLLFVSGEYWGRVSNTKSKDEKTLPLDKFLNILSEDWSILERGDFSDSGSIRIPVVV